MESYGGNTMDEVSIVRRDRTVKWYRVVDREGREHRWKMHGNGIGAFHFTDPEQGQVSPQLWGLPAVRGWLLRNGYTPAGSRSPEWAKHLAERAERQAAA